MARTLWMRLSALTTVSAVLLSINIASINAAPYPIEGSFTAQIIQTNQQGRSARSATMTIQMGGLFNSFPYLNNTSTDCFNQPGPGPAYAYSVQLDSSFITMSQCEAYNGTEIIRNAWAFIIDPFTATTTKATPTEIANAMVAKGTLGSAFTISSGGGREVIFTRTNTNDGNILLTDNDFHSSDAFRVVNVVSWQSPLTSLVQQATFTPANVWSGEIYLMDIDGYTYNYTAKAGDGVSDVTAGIIALYMVDQAPNITCVDQTTRVLCSGVFDTQSFSIDAYVTYPTTDTTAPLLTLLGSASETIAVGSGYTDLGASWIDNRDGTGTILATSGSVNTNVVGTYSLEYKKIDSSTNQSNTVSRTVNVVDMSAPIVTVLGASSITHEVNLTYSDSGATWTDNVDGTGVLTASGIAQLSSTGIYTLTYTKIDAAGNIGTGSRTVNVVDTIAPVVTITTPAVTVDASVYQISGNALLANLVEIYTGASIIASTSPVGGYFSFFVPLAPSSANTFLIRASDADGNIGTGQVIITSSTASSPFSWAVSVTGATLSWVTTFSGGSFTSVSRITLKSPVAFASGSGSGIIPNGTVVTSTSGGTFDPSALNALVVTASGLDSNQTSKWALEFGISNVGLNFSKPVKIQIPVPGYTSSTIAIKVKHGGTSTYVTTGLTNSATATCTNGVASSPSAVATVANGIATIYTCAGSTFVAYTETTTPTGGSTGGGSGVWYTFSPSTLSGSPLPPPTPLGSGSTISTEVARFDIDAKSLSKSKVLKTTTSLKNGTKIYVYRVSARGKEIRVGLTRVGKWMIQYRIKLKGTYIFRTK